MIKISNKRFNYILIFVSLVSCVPLRKGEKTVSSPLLNTYQKGLAALEEGDYVQAEALFKLALRDSTSFAPAYIGLARTFFLEKNYNRAEQAVNKALQIEPFHPVALFLRAKIYYRIGAWDFALEDISNCLKNDGFSAREDLTVTARLLKARIYFDTGQFARAKLNYKKVLRLAPGHPQAMRGLQQTEKVLTLLDGKSARFAKIVAAAQITRGDLAVILKEELSAVRLDSLPKDSAFSIPRDVYPSLPEFESIVFTLRNDWLPILPDSTFRPADTVDRAELALFELKILKAFHTELPKSALELQIFKDIPPTDPLYFAVQMADWYDGLPFISGEEFSSREKVTGYQAVLSIQQLKAALKTALFPAHPKR